MAGLTPRRSALPAAAMVLPLFVAAPAGGQGALDWIEKPTPLDLRAAYPQKALDERVEARVLLRCDVRPDGRVESCGVASEEPSGYGFGASALNLSSKFKLALAGAAARGGVPEADR
jgi:TonB family protein